MNRDETGVRRHESVDHEQPTDAGLMDSAWREVPGTGIMGDETLIRDADGEGAPGIYPGASSHRGGVAHPGPTPAAEEDRLAEGTGNAERG